MAGERTLDPAALERLTEWGGAELRTQMIALFLENAPERVGRILHGVEGGDLEDAQLAAHSLKSTAANVGAEALGSVAARIEALLEAESGTPDVRALLPDLESALDATREELRAALDTSGA